MPQLGRIDTDCASFTAAAAIAQNLRVKATTTANTVDVAGSTDATLGTAERAGATDEVIAVRLMSAPTQVMIANGAVAVAAEVFAAAAGKVATTGTLSLGIALTAAAADGDQILVAATK